MSRTAATQPTMHIGELAERTGLSLRTIRHYDEVDLLRPSGRTEGGFRLYTETDLERLLLIRRMKPLGFTLEEMREMLTIVDALEAPRTSTTQTHLHIRLGELIATATERRAALQRQLHMADELIELLRSHQPAREGARTLSGVLSSWPAGSAGQAREE